MILMTGLIDKMRGGRGVQGTKRKNPVWGVRTAQSPFAEAVVLSA